MESSRFNPYRIVTYITSDKLTPQLTCMKKLLVLSAVILLSLTVVSCAGSGPHASKGKPGCGAYGNP